MNSNGQNEQFWVPESSLKAESDEDEDDDGDVVIGALDVTCAVLLENILNVGDAGQHRQSHEK